MTFVSPSLEAWWNLGPKWVIRGGTGINVLTSRASATDVYFNHLSIGRYLTGYDARFFRQLVVFVTATTLSDVAGRSGFIDDIYVTPGARFGLGQAKDWYVQGGGPGPGQRPAAVRLPGRLLAGPDLLSRLSEAHLGTAAREGSQRPVL